MKYFSEISCLTPRQIPGLKGGDVKTLVPHNPHISFILHDMVFIGFVCHPYCRLQTADSGLGKAVPEMASTGSHRRYCRGLSSRAGKTALSLHVGDDVVLEAGRQTPAMPLKLYCELPLGHWRQARLRTFGRTGYSCETRFMLVLTFDNTIRCKTEK